MSVMPWEQSLLERLSLLKEGTIRIGYVYERAEPGTFRYRCYNMTQALNAHSTKYSASYFFLHDLHNIDSLNDFVDVLVLVRVRFDADVDRLIRRFRLAGKPVLYDLDDHIFELEATPLLVSSLNQGLSRYGRIEKWVGVVGRIRHSLELVDRVITTTDFLAGQLRESFDIPVEVVPNFLNEEQLEYSAELRNTSKGNEQDRPVIGYFSGSASHNRDYQIAEDGLRTVLEEFPNAVLRIAGYLDVPESLRGYHSRIERLPFMNFLELQKAISEATLNLSPIQHNVFAHSKSELKYFEAAAVGVLTIASPSPVFTQTIQHGKNGFLADAAEWPDVLREAITMPDTRRQRMVAHAVKHVEKHYTGAAVAPAIERTLAGLSS